MEKCWKPSKVSHQFLLGAMHKKAKVICFPHCEDKLLLIMKGSQLEDQILYCEGKDGINAYLWDRNFCWIVAGLRVGRVVRCVPENIRYYPPIEMLDPFYEKAKEIRDNPAQTLQEDAARRVEIRRRLMRLLKAYILEEDKKREGEYQVWGLFDGWEYVVSGEDKDDALRLLKEYRENDRDHLYKLRVYRGGKRINKTVEV